MDIEWKKADNSYSWIAIDNLNTCKTFNVGYLESYLETFKTHILCFYKRLNYIKFTNTFCFYKYYSLNFKKGNIIKNITLY